MKNFRHPIAVLLYCQDTLSLASPGRLLQRDHHSIDLWDDTWETVLGKLQKGTSYTKNHPIRLSHIEVTESDWYWKNDLCNDDWDLTVSKIKELVG